ncbi:hypothetical protein X975_24778, partial [Stegodyphus mimosarum]
MEIRVVIFMIFCVTFLIFSEGRKISRRKENFDRLLANSSLTLQENPPSKPKNKTGVFTSWSTWSRCSRKCR